MNKFTKNYNFLAEKSGLKQNIIASRLGIDPATIWKWKQGSIPNTGTLSKLAKIFSDIFNVELTSDDLLEKDVEVILKAKGSARELADKTLPYDQKSPINDFKNLPIIESMGEIPEYDIVAGAGTGKAVNDEHIKGWREVYPDISSSAKYVIRARGNSMVGAGIGDGDLLFVAPIQNIGKLKDGDIIILSDDNNDILVKYYHKLGDNIILVSASPDYKPIIKSIDSIKIIGKVIHSSHLISF